MSETTFYYNFVTGLVTIIINSNSRMRHFFISLISIALALSVTASENILFKHFTMRDGLSDNQVNSITRDSKGFIWISTSYGLCRYDGYEFRNFMKESNNPESLPFYCVESVQEDHEGMLWVSFGLKRYACYNPVKEVFTDAGKMLSEKYGIEREPGLIYVDGKKDLWVAAKDGTLYHVSSKDGKTVRVKNARRKGVDITSVSSTPEGVAAIYSDGSFINISRDSNTAGKPNDYIGRISPNTSHDYRIFCDSDGDYWIKRVGQTWLYHAQDGRWTDLSAPSSILSGKNVKSFASDRHGRIWLAIENGGIDIVEKKTMEVKHLRNNVADPRSLCENNVTCLYADPDGGMWAGSFKHGLSYYNENVFRFRIDNFNEFHSIRNFNPDVISITEDADRNLWFATPSGIIKVDCLTKEKKLTALPQAKDGQPEMTIISMLADRRDNIWLATYNHGLIKYDGKEFRHQPLDPDNPCSLVNRTVWSVAEDKSGYLWIGTWGGGLYGLDPDNGRIRNYASGDENFNRSEIASICLSNDNNIYLGTTYGIDVFSPITGRFEKLLGNRSGSQQLTNTLIVQLFEDSRNLLWIATREGLNVYDRRNDEIILPVKELKHTIIFGVAEDNDKNMWVTTSDGLYHIVVNSNPNSRRFTFSHQPYYTRNSFEDFGFNQNCLKKHSSGVIASGGICGISLINPMDLRYDTVLPDVHFTRLQLFNRDIKIDSVYDGVRILESAPAFAKELRLNYDQNVFSVEFSAMNYVAPENVTYLYMLEGFDSDWMKSTSNKLTYTNLAPGEYTLKVKAVNGDGYGSDRAAELKIRINPPFWNSWKAYILYFMLFIGVILLIRMYLRHNESQKYELLKIQQEAQHKHELDDMKLRFFTNISHDLRTPLTLILTPLEYVIGHIENGDIKDKLKMARNNAMRLLGMVNQLLDFRKSDMNGHNLNPTCGNIVDTIRTSCDNFIEYSEHRNINLTFFSSVKSLYMKFDQDKISKIMMNLLSNAFKFTPEGGRVDVWLELISATADSPETLEIKVADNGCGIDDEHKKMIFDRFYQVPNGSHSTGSGIGLNLVHEFVTLHNGTVTVCDNVGKGAVFIISIPVVRPDESDASSVSESCGPDTEKPSADSTADIAETSEKGKADNKRPTILIVDDNSDFRKFMNDCLKEHYEICEAADGAEAWKMIPDLQPDVIVSDVMMPEMDGNELCRMVKTDIRTSHIPVILLTARAAKEHELKGLENGADDYITKPFNLDILTHRIKNLLVNRQDSRRKAMDISPSRISITPLDEKLMKKAISYVEENMERSNLSVEELSSELGMSRVHLYKKLVAITGKTPVEFIRIIRLKRAAQLLAESQLNIAEVTYQTGFNNLSLFRKYFKNEFGVLPSEYQAKHSKKYNESI